MTHKRPAGTTAVLAAAAVILCGKIGVTLTPDEVAVLIGAATIVVSWFTPRA